MGGWGSARPRQLMLGCICKRQTVAEIAAPLPAVPCQALSVQHFYVPASRLFTTQVHHLNRELLAERTRVKALSEELENPLNVHRWAGGINRGRPGGKLPPSCTSCGRQAWW